VGIWLKKWGDREKMTNETTRVVIKVPAKLHDILWHQKIKKKVKLSEMIIEILTEHFKEDMMAEEEDETPQPASPTNPII